MLVYPSAMTVSTQTLTFVADRLRAHREQLGTRWRLLSSGRQALMVLAHLRVRHEALLFRMEVKDPMTLPP